MQQPHHQETNPDQTNTIPTVPTQQGHIPKLRSYTGPMGMQTTPENQHNQLGKLKTTILDHG